MVRISLDRRQFLTRTGAAAVGAAGALGAPGIAGAATKNGSGHAASHAGDPLLADGAVQKAVVSDPSARLPAVPFHGRHQAGITNAPPPAACFAVFNATADTRGALISTLQTLTQRARFLTHGGVPADLGTVSPPSDSGTLGPDIPPDGLTVTVGLGASLFENPVFGLADKKPKRLTEMTSFPNDNLQPDITGGDILLQICAGQPDTAIHALRDIAKHTRGRHADRVPDGRVPGAAKAGWGAAEPSWAHGRDRQSERGGPIRRRPAAVGHRQDR